MAKTKAPTNWRVTEWHTASNLSGSVKGDTAYFVGQQEALAYYTGLVEKIGKPEKDGLFNKEIIGVELSRTEGWIRVMTMGRLPDA